MAGVYSRRRVVLSLGLVVALLTNPLLAAGVESSASDDASSLAVATPTDGLTEILPTIDLDTVTPTSTPTPTPNTTDSDDELTDPLTDVEDTLTDVTNDTEETLNDTEETLNNTEETLNDTVGIVNDTVENTSDTIDDAEGTLENETDDTADTLSDDSDDVAINVTVEDALAGETVQVDVPAKPTPGVAFDSLGIDVQRDGGFELALTSSDDPLTAPPLSAQAGTVPLGYIHLNHTIANENVGNVTVTFRVDADRVTASDADPEDIALYRYSGGTWTELSTELVGKVGDQYVYRAESPGLSEFAAGAKRPSFEVPSATVETDVVEVGDDVAVRVRIENHGGADGVYVAALTFDGEVVDERDVSVAAGGSRVATFREAVESPGTYAVSINDVQAGEVEVQAAGTTAEPTAQNPEAAGVAPEGGQPGFGAVVAFVALLAAGLFGLRRHD